MSDLDGITIQPLANVDQVFAAADVLAEVWGGDRGGMPPNLLRALAHVRAGGTDFRCVLVGRGLDRDNAPLCARIDELGLADRIVLAGQRADVGHDESEVAQRARDDAVFHGASGSRLIGWSRVAHRYWVA